MKPQDVFGIVVRSLGLLCLGYGFQYIVSWVFLALKQNVPAEGWASFNYLVIGLVCVAAGLFLLRKARLIIRFAYPEPKDRSPAELEALNDQT